MHISFRPGWVKWWIAASLLAGGTASARAQEPRDANIRRAFDDGRTTTDFNSSLSSQPTPSRQTLPIVFRQREDSSPTVVRGNGSSTSAPLPLAPPKDRRSQKSAAASPTPPKGSVTTVLGSLAMVLGAFFALAWFARRASPQTTTVLPKEVVETLGRTSLGNRQYLQLVRLGNKLLLLSVSPHATETLTEVTTADEVERLTALCQQHQPGSVTTTFRSILAQLGNEPAAPGFLGNSESDEFEQANAPRGRRSRLRAREEDHD